MKHIKVKLDGFSHGHEDPAIEYCQTIDVSVSAYMERPEEWDRNCRTIGYGEPHVASTPAFTANLHILSPAANEAYSNHLLARYESNANFRAMVDAELIAVATAEIQNARDEAVIAQDEYRKAEGW